MAVISHFDSNINRKLYKGQQQRCQVCPGGIGVIRISPFDIVIRITVEDR